jgi:hypothetical protein
MELLLSIVLGVLVLAVALVVPRAIGPTSSLRRRVPGLLLLGLGLMLLGSQLPPSPGRLLLGLAMLIVWGATGLALIAGKAWARLPGLVLAGAGVAVACWLSWRVDQWANELGRSDDRVLVDLFFLADGPYYSWAEVGVASFLFALLSAIAGAFLLLPFRAPVHGPESASRQDVGSAAE